MSNRLNSAKISIVSATSDDVHDLFQLVTSLADYEKLAHEVTGTPEALAQSLFGDRPYAEAILAKVGDTSVGFALFFHNFSTFLMKPGIYLEDLFVLPEYRGHGIGKMLLQALGSLAIERDCGRLEWRVLDWNEPAIAFYKRMGAAIKVEWQLCQVAGDNLQRLAAYSDFGPGAVGSERSDGVME